MYICVNLVKWNINDWSEIFMEACDRSTASGKEDRERGAGVVLKFISNLG